MYLKSIEVQGFKSFANKIVFEFHNGITGIVGPNGSGKSNVADAVRWVLGEQRAKQLRGGNMQDVIFAGTENRKPLSYASVAITLDNSDKKLPVEYSEVKVTRKLYRSGESEYLINGTQCRLKDINEMFYDTGIGKEGYSIIGQGQIEKILNGKPEERRELFDEAAGIVKFKRRKNMSVKKLEEEQQNLVRVTDILKELEKQFLPLQKQSETAKEYLKKKEELKRFDINMFLMETSRLRTSLKEIDDNLQIGQAEFDESSERFDAMKAEYEEIEEKGEQIEVEIEDTRKKIHETTLLKQQLENKIALLQEQINSSKAKDAHFEQRKMAVLQQMEARDLEKQNLEKQKEELLAEIEETKKKRQDAQENLKDHQMQILESGESIENGQSEIMDLLNNRATTTAKVQHYDTMMQQLKVKRAETYKKILDLQSELQEEEKLKEQYTDELKKISDEILAETQKKTAIETKIQSLQQQISKLNEEIRTVQNEFHRAQSKLESLKNLTERYEGYGNSIRKVMEQKNQYPGIHGVVADLIKVEKTHETAIEIALGGTIQNIVTDNEETARQMIEYLKKNRFGRATFLPLTAMRGKNGAVNPSVLKEKDVIGTADQLVHVEDQYRTLMEQLLGKTIVVSKLEQGILLAKKYHQSLRIVSLEGDLINPGGAMSGGAYKNSSNLLGRKRELEELEQLTLHAEASLKAKMKQLEEAKTSRANQYQQIDQIQEILQQKYVVQNTAKMNEKQMTLKMEQGKINAVSILKEREKIDADIKEIQENQESIQLELETSVELEKVLQGQVERMQAELEQKRKEESLAIQKHEEVNTAYAALEQKMMFHDTNVQRVEEEQKKLEEELQELEDNKGESGKEVQEKEKEIHEIESVIENSAELFEELNQMIKEQQETKEEINRSHKAFLEKRDSLSKRISDLDKEIFRLSSRKESYEQSVEKQINYMWEEYEITFNHAMELRDDTLTDLSVIKKRIQELKGEIKGLGAVNVNAIEEFKQLSERYEFLKTQHDDLIIAEESLRKIIAELDAAMRKQFVEQFARIKDEFDKVFKELFGGGKGTLELMEDEDLLEAGIRIIAQPPGKKLQNMMQLSGGEKSLTAISLLFAIQNLKPSPFCLLDEIEAALDDSNVVRFAKYLGKLTKDTQFIVITHRRGTMTAADRLYGITMQEKGISTLVSVDLIEDDLDKQKVEE